MKVKQSKTELTVQHEGKDLTIVHPFYGPNNYLGLKGQTREDKPEVLMATMPEASSIVHDAYVIDSGNQYSKEVRNKMKNNYFYTATKSLWTPNDGVRVFPDNGSIQLPSHLQDKIGELSQSELEEMLKSLEKSPELVKFVNYGFKREILSSLELATNPYVKALAGEEGALKLAEVSDKHSTKLYLCALPNTQKPLVTVSRLVSLWNFGGRLGVIGDYLGDNGDCFAFGVLNSGEATKKTKEK